MKPEENVQTDFYKSRTLTWKQDKMIVKIVKYCFKFL